MIINLSSYTGSVSRLVAVLLLLAVFGASMQCVADCLPQPNTPPCHQHSQKKEPCKHGQFVAVTQAASDQPIALVTHLAQAPDPEEASLILPVRLLTILRI
jgi:hypothetical protein